MTVNKDKLSHMESPLGDDKRKGNIPCEILTREKRMIICAKKEEENARKNPSHIYIYVYIYDRKGKVHHIYHRGKHQE